MELVGAWQKLTKVMRSKKLQPHLIFLPPSVNNPEKIERVIVRYIKIHFDAEAEKRLWDVKADQSQEMYEDHESYQLQAEEEKSKLVEEFIDELEQTQSS